MTPFFCRRRGGRPVGSVRSGSGRGRRQHVRRSGGGARCRVTPRPRANPAVRVIRLGRTRFRAPGSSKRRRRRRPRAATRRTARHDIRPTDAVRTPHTHTTRARVMFVSEPRSPYRLNSVPVHYASGTHYEVGYSVVSTQPPRHPPGPFRLVISSTRITGRPSPHSLCTTENVSPATNGRPRGRRNSRFRSTTPFAPRPIIAILFEQISIAQHTDIIHR